MTITPDNAWIYAFLSELSYRRADTDMGVKLRLLVGSELTSKFSDQDTARNELNAFFATSDVDDHFSRREDGSYRYQIKTHEKDGVVHYWNDMGFSALIVKDGSAGSTDANYTVVFRGTDQSGVDGAGANFGDILGFTFADEFNPNDQIGTDPLHSDEGDWYSNVKLGRGTYTETHYDYALALTQYVIQQLAGDNPAKVTVTGQSLGGGLAALVGAELGLDIYAFGIAPFKNQLVKIAEKNAVLDVVANNADVFSSESFSAFLELAPLRMAKIFASYIFREASDGQDAVLNYGGLVLAYGVNVDDSKTLLDSFHAARSSYLAAYENHINNNSRSFGSTIEGEFTTSEGPGSLLRAGIHAGPDDLYTGNYDLIVDVGNEVWQGANTSSFFNSIGALREGDLSDYSNNKVFVQEASVRHSPALNALLLATENEPNKAISLSLRNDDYLKFALFHTPGLAGQVIENKVGETGDPSISLGGYIGVEPLYRLLLNSKYRLLLNSKITDSSFYNDFYEFFRTITLPGTALTSEPIVDGGLFSSWSGADKNLHNTVIKFALQILRDALNQQEDYTGFEANLQAIVGITDTKFAGNFAVTDYIDLNIDAIIPPADNTSHYQEFITGNFLTYGLSDLYTTIHDEIIDNLHMNFLAKLGGAEKDFADEITGLETVSAYSTFNRFTDYSAFNTELSNLVVQVSAEGGVIDLTTNDVLRRAYDAGTPEEEMIPQHGAAIFAGDGLDDITGTERNDYIITGDGNNVIRESLGSDVIIGGAGQDTYYAQWFEDRDFGETGIITGDVFLGGAGDDIANYWQYKKGGGGISYELDTEIKDGLRHTQVVRTQEDNAVASNGTFFIIDNLYDVENIYHTQNADTVFIAKLQDRAREIPILRLFFDAREETISPEPEPPANGAAGFQAKELAQEEPPQEPDRFYKSDYDTVSYGKLGFAVDSFRGLARQSVPEPDVDFTTLEGQIQALTLPLKRAVELREDVIETASATYVEAEVTVLTDYNDIHLFTYREDDTFESTGFYDFGRIEGRGGDDTILAYNPGYRLAGQLLDPHEPMPESGEPDLRQRAGEDLFLEIDGGDGDDNLFVVGGAGARVVGGAGQDLIFSWSERSLVWGNEVDTAANQTSQDESDMFWWSPGAFVQDADPVDFVSVFGFTLTGGSNFLTKFGQTGGNQVIDSLMWFMGYSSTDSGQLLIHYLKPDLEYLTNVMIIEDYDYASDFTGAGDEVLGIVAGTGDLGLRFRVWNADDGVEISLFNAMWGEIAFYLGQFDTFVKGLNWRSDKDPLVLDLDGDGLETVRVSQSRANFDLDDDFFAERTGWVDSDDGLLAVDRNADGVIDDISELFGGNNPDGVEQTGFAANDNGICVMMRRVA